MTNFVTLEEFNNHLELKDKVYSRVHKILNDYGNNRNDKYLQGGSVTDYSAYDGELHLSVEMFFGSCGTEFDHIKVPVEALWSDSWVEDDKLMLANQEIERIKQKKEKEIKDKKLAEEQERKHYEQLKRKYG